MKSLKKKINITVEKTPTGFSAFADDLNVFTTAENVNDLYLSLIESLNFHYEDLGYTITKNNLKLNFDFQQFFQYYKVLNAKFLAERIGMNPTLLSQYVRGIKRPSTKQTTKIITGIQSIGKELSELNFG